MLNAQTIEYGKYYQEEFGISGRDLLFRTDGDYLLSGYTTADGSPSGVNFYTAIVNKDGNLIKKRIYGDTLRNYLESSCELSNGNFAFAGYSEDNTGGSKFTILLTNNEGDSLWMKSHGQGKVNIPDKIIETTDDNLLIVGATNTGRGASRKASMSKIGFDGALIWEKIIGRSADENIALDVIELDNGNFIVAGWSKSENTSGYLISVNHEGEFLWEKNITLKGYEMCTDLELANDGKILVGGHTGKSPSMEFSVPILFKIDLDGNILWQKEYKSMDGYSWGSRIYQDKSDNIFLLGSSERTGSVNLWFMKLDHNGQEDYRIFFGDDSGNWGSSLSKLEGDAMGILSGSKHVNAETDRLFNILYFIKLKDITANNIEFKTKKNLIGKRVIVEIDESYGLKMLSVTDASGKTMHSLVANKSGKFKINVSGYTPGVYNLTLVTISGEVITKKFMVNQK